MTDTELSDAQTGDVEPIHPVEDVQPVRVKRPVGDVLVRCLRGPHVERLLVSEVPQASDKDITDLLTWYVNIHRVGEDVASTTS